MSNRSSSIVPIVVHDSDSWTTNIILYIICVTVYVVIIIYTKIYWSVLSKDQVKLVCATKYKYSQQLVISVYINTLYFTESA